MPEKSLSNEAQTAVLSLVKLVVLANAGGVAATMTAIGAAGMRGLLAVPLGFFSLGVSLSILYAMGTTFRLLKSQGEDPLTPAFFDKPGFALWTGFSAVACFILGALSGVFIVACGDPLS